MSRLASVFLFTLCACVREGKSSDFTLRIATVAEVGRLEPQLSSGYSMLIKSLVYSLLFEPDVAGDWQSQLLSQWVRVGPGRYRVKLKPTIRFSDRSPVREEDVIASLAASGLRGVAREEWIEIQSTNPGVPIEPLLLQAVLFRDGPDGPLGTGPFSVIAQDAGHLLVRRVQSAPGRIAQVELLGFASPGDAFASALKGEVNALITPDPGQMELIRGVPRFRLVGAPGLHSVAAVFNARRLSRAERKALVDSIPIEEIGRVHGGNCEIAQRSQPSNSIPAGAPLDLLVTESDPPMTRVALALRRALGSRGGSLETGQLKFAAQRTLEGRFDIVVAALQVWPPAVAALRWHSKLPMNIVGYSNPAVDAALDAGDYARAEQELALDPPALFICRRERTAAIDARVKNPKLGPYDLFESLPEWEVTP